jgi:hypothetical protein
MGDIQTVVLIDQQGSSFLDGDQVVDAGGNRFVAVVESEPLNNNVTWVTVRRFTPSGAISQQWTIDPSDDHKIDKVAITHSGQDLLFLIVTHEDDSDNGDQPEATIRSIRIESAVIPGVFINSAGLDQEEGGAGAFTGQQRFADVLPGSTFYTYIEYLASKGAIGGYRCGEDPGEPCVPPQNLPYFRPGNPLTRGQICKIIALALDFNPG